MSRYKALPSSFFTKNRSQFIDQMKPHSMAVFFSADMMPRSGDTHFQFRQNPDFYYLTGIDQEACALILCPDHPVKSLREQLFLLETNDHIAVWEGKKIDKAEGKERSGIATVLWMDQFEAQLARAAGVSKNIYINLNENDRAASEVADVNLRFARRVKRDFPLHNTERSGLIMSRLRTAKKEEEIAVMQKACNITDKAFRRILKSIEPGRHEFLIEADITHTFLTERGNGHAYDPIIASGKNACVLHYTSNNDVCEDGELLLMDFGCEYGNYAADLSRTVPVNGKFTDRQREIYMACYRVHQYIIEKAKPGMTLQEINQMGQSAMTEELIALGLVDEKASKEEQKQTTRKYFPHGTSHFIGLDVHDMGDRYAPIPENACITVEPGLYLPEENLGVRIENDIVLRSDGNIDLMAHIPITIEEIEALMAG